MYSKDQLFSLTPCKVTFEMKQVKLLHFKLIVFVKECNSNTIICVILYVFMELIRRTNFEETFEF